MTYAPAEDLTVGWGLRAHAVRTCQLCVGRAAASEAVPRSVRIM